MKIFIAFIFAWTSNGALASKSSEYPVEQVILDSTTPGKFILGTKDYEDIRIDSDLDGKVDFWYLKSKSLESSIKYKNGSAIQIVLKKQISHNSFREVILQRSRTSAFLIVSNKVKESPTLHGSIDDQCITARDSLTMQAQKLMREAGSPVLKKNIMTYVDDSCFNIDSSESFQRNLANALIEVFNDGLSSSQDSFHNCLTGVRVQNLFKKDSSNETKLSLEVLSSRMSLDLKKIARLPSEDKVPLFSCNIDEKTKVPNAVYKEGAGIALNFPKNSFNTITSPQLVKLLRHELIHRAGLEDEAATDSLLSVCPKSTQDDLSMGTINSASKSGGNIVPANVAEVANATADTSGSANTSGASAQHTTQTKNSSRGPASDTGGGSSGVDMKSEISQAQAAVPSGEKLATIKVDKSPEGIQAAVKESIAESTPVLRMANQLMGASNTPALASSSGDGGGSSYNNSEVAKSDIAAPSSYEPSSSSRGSSSSDTSSSRRYQRTSKYESSGDTVVSSEGPKVITSKSNSGLAPGERVVEEIDLTKGTNYRATNVPTRGQQGNTREVSASRTTAASREPASAVPPAPANPVGEVAAPGPISQGSTGGSVGRLSGSSETNTPAAPSTSRRVSGNRGPASSGSTQNNVATSREEVVTFLSNGSYSLTKNKLRDTGFVNTLKSNKVTIIDLYGNSFGASRGDVIFLDDGNKFVRQK